MNEFEDKVVLITGGAGVIGLAAAKKFLGEGARVALVDTSEEALESAVKHLSGGDRVAALSADVTTEVDVEAYVRRTLDTFGKIDVFFNNAGIEGVIKPVTEVTVEELDSVLAVNVRGIFLGLKHVLPVLYAQRHGSVINTSSVAGLGGAPGGLPYYASKHAVVGITKVVALEAAEHHVRVNSIHPAPVEGRMMRSLEKSAMPDDAASAKELFQSLIPLGRYGTADDVANLVYFLGSEASTFITGAQYRVDGGMGAKQ